ncbi:hypothetical protein [Bacillus sp. 1P06AnD]|uniref:hypothetical protein n=1 Tax=Bacillus sp. 1P06AnD TaxID=3132208 RepID=UPI0039A2A97A
MRTPSYSIASDRDGVIEKVFIKKDAYVYEWEDLFLIKTSDDQLVNISLGVSGHITEMNVEIGNRVKRNDSLAVIQDDYLITGSD